MKTLINSTFRRIALAGLVASSVVGSALVPAQAAPGTCYFGECEPARPSQKAASSDFNVLARHGSWTAMTDGKLTLIVNRFDDNSKFAIVDKNNELGLAWSYDNWHWRTGQKFSIKIEIDGHVYDGTAEATSATMLVAKDVKNDFVRALYNGHKAKMDIAGDTFTTTTLTDAAASIDDAVRFRKTSAR